ncbi:hypothetical protein [Novosphingobium profundi]|uniref:hypothetical protein n=1 Tax=Novosphingobium profundi TaxID=1774954 RepID=UPI001CFCB33D|nr:hypothetical protein [Novosphingobium profundi]
MRYRVRLAAAALVLLLTGCTQYYDLVAGKEGDSIVFTPGNWGGWSDPGCVRQVAVTPVASGEDVLGVGVDGSGLEGAPVWSQAVSQEACSATFPLAYGQALGVPGEETPPPLVPGQPYMVHIITEGPDFGSGLFVIDAQGEVENLDSAEFASAPLAQASAAR